MTRYVPQFKTSPLYTHYSSWRYHFIRTTLSFVRVIPAVVFAVTPIAIADTMSVSTRDQVVGAISNYIVIYNSNRTVRTSHEWPELQHQSNKKNIKRKHIWYARHRWSTSSEKSPQSLLPSQVFLKSMHFLFVHSNPEPVKHIIFFLY